MHLHTRISDGTDAPEELLAHVREAGIRCFSVTDHDSLKSSHIFPELLPDNDPVYVTGVEFSCKDEKGKYHILGFGYEPDGKTINEVAELGHVYRVRKIKRRLSAIKETFGICLPDQAVEELMAQENPGKPHLGNILVQYGFAPSRGVAIKEIINKSHVDSEFVRPEEAIEGILLSGGLAVLAHPSFGSGTQSIRGDELEERVDRLKKMGLSGLETFYSGFTAELTDELLALSEKYDLLVSAGSDYHGKNKTVVLGDTGVLGKYPEIPRLSAFVEEVEKRSLDLRGKRSAD